jgi:hypothetical protein
MKIRQLRTCPVCEAYRNFRGWTFPLSDIDQERTFCEGRKPTNWRHTSRLSRFLHHRAEGWQASEAAIKATGG